MTTTRRRFLGFLATTTALTCVAPQAAAPWACSADGGSLGYIHFEGMANVSSLSECNATPGSVFVDGQSIYLHPGSKVSGPDDFGWLPRCTITAYG